MHEHLSCPHEHEGDVCPYHVDDVVADDADESPDVEAVQIAADAAVEIARIEAETEAARIAAELDHHELSNDANETDNDASLEHHHIEAEVSQEQIDEVVEELVEEIQELEEVVLAEPEASDGSVDAGALDAEDLEEGGGAPTSVAPPPRVEAPNSSSGSKAVHRTGGALRRGRR